jgi:hypothetical protein
VLHDCSSGAQNAGSAYGRCKSPTQRAPSGQPLQLRPSAADGAQKFSLQMQPFIERDEDLPSLLLVLSGHGRQLVCPSRS